MKSAILIVLLFALNACATVNGGAGSSAPYSSQRVCQTGGLGCG